MLKYQRKLQYETQCIIFYCHWNKEAMCLLYLEINMYENKQPEKSYKSIRKWIKSMVISCTLTY